MWYIYSWLAISCVCCISGADFHHEISPHWTFLCEPIYQCITYWPLVTVKERFTNNECVSLWYAMKHYETSKDYIFYVKNYIVLYKRQGHQDYFLFLIFPNITQKVHLFFKFQFLCFFLWEGEMRAMFLFFIFTHNLWASSWFQYSWNGAPGSSSPS